MVLPISDEDVITELQAGNKLLKQERYRLKQRIQELEAENKELKETIEDVEMEQV